MMAMVWLLAALSGRDCGTTVRTLSRFRGTVRSVKVLDNAFAVTINVDRVDAGVTEPRVGQRLTFAVHSPTQTFADGEPLGRAFDLQAERVDCDGKFDGFVGLERRWSKSIIETVHGPLRVGHVYRAEHAPDVDFTNAAEFPKRAHEIVFEVTSLRITASGERVAARILSAR